MENVQSVILEISWQKHKQVMLAILCTDGEALRMADSLQLSDKLRNGTEVVVNNSWVVPHLPLTIQDVHRTYKCEVLQPCKGHQI
jgi:hypothetical protein